MEGFFFVIQKRFRSRDLLEEEIRSLRRERILEPPEQQFIIGSLMII